MNTATAPHTAGPDIDAEAAEFRRLTGVMRALNHDAEKVRSTRDMTVYRLLVDSGLTQAQLADVLGVSPATVQASVRNARQEELPELNFSDTYQQGRWLRELRLRQSMTKQDLARNLGVPKSWVDDVESGDARLGDGRVPRAFDALGADVRRFQAYGWPDNA